MTTIAFYQTHLDSRVVLTGSYSAGTTTFTATAPCFATYALYLPTGVAYALTQTSLTTLTASGDLSGGQSILGTYSPFSVDLSEVIARDAAGSAEIGLAVLLQSITVFHVAAGGFNITVAHSNSTIYPSEVTSHAPDLTAAQPTVYARKRVRVGSIAERTTISLGELTWKPASISGFEVPYEVCEGMR
jgi:hypothetical protein